MSDPFDPYREALIIETRTVWPDEYDYLESHEKQRLASMLHASPEEASELEYTRLHSGFCRTIVVSPDDMARVQ